MPSHATLTQREHAWPAFCAARMGLGKSGAVAACQSSRFEWPPAYPSSAPSTARSVVASVEVDAPADMPHDKPSSNGLGRAIGAGWARSRAGGACQSSRFECSAAHPSSGAPSATRSTVAVSSIPERDCAVALRRLHVTGSAPSAASARSSAAESPRCAASSSGGQPSELIGRDLRLGMRAAAPGAHL